MTKIALATISLVLALGVGSPPAAAATHTVTLGYDLYVGGVRLLVLEIEGDLAPASYDIKIRFRAEGFFGRLMPFSMEAFSQGVFAAAATQPRVAGQRNVWSGKERRVDLRYLPDGSVEARAEPPATKDDGDPVSQEDRRHTVDLVSAILAVLKTIEGGAPCERSVPVFDGRRRYDFLAVDEGKEWLKKSSYSTYEGETVTCRIVMNAVSGFWNKRPNDEPPPERSARVHIGQVSDGVMPLPVRLEMETELGSLRAHLMRSRVSMRREAARVPGRE